jgi:signal transduction histidine kinase
MTMDNILHWSLTQMNRIEARPELVLLPDLFRQVISDTALAAKKKNITLLVEVPDDIQVWADSGQLRLVLLNLLHNAVKFSNKAGTVIVSATPVVATEDVEITVADNGIGMTAEEANRLLNEKNVHSRQGTANEAGTGMGILLCKEFVAANGGSLQVESHVNKGARFYFHLPANKQ